MQKYISDSANNPVTFVIQTIYWL